MTGGKNTFGEKLTSLRKSRRMSLRALATQLGVSAPYLSDVENGRNGPLTIERLERVKEILNLTDDEYADLNDAAAEWKQDSIAPDLPKYLSSNPKARMALRTARDLDATDQDWLEFIQHLKDKEQR